VLPSFVVIVLMSAPLYLLLSQVSNSPPDLPSIVGELSINSALASFQIFLFL
jgi:hypothetical protein